MYSDLASNNSTMLAQKESYGHTVCPRSSDSFYMVTCYIKWVTISWTYSISLSVLYSESLYKMGQVSNSLACSNTIPDDCKTDFFS